MKIELANNAGVVSVTLQADYLSLSDEDKRFVDDIAAMFRAYQKARAPGECQASLHGPKVYADSQGRRCICYG